jgi:hypothetical protein
MITKQLPWQVNEFLHLVSVQQSIVESSTTTQHEHSLPLNSHSSEDNIFGLDYVDLDDNAMKMTVLEAENTILKAFEISFGTLDKFRIMQSLLYDSIINLLPSQKTRNSSKKFCNTSYLNDLFKHVSFAVALDTSFLNSSLNIRKIRSKLPHIHYTNDENNNDHLSNSNDNIERTSSLVEDSQKENLSLYYELLKSCLLLITKLAKWVVNMSPYASLDMNEICIMLSEFLQIGNKEMIERETMLLALKLGRNDKATIHSEYLINKTYQKLRMNDNHYHDYSCDVGIDKSSVNDVIVDNQQKQHQTMIIMNEMIFLTKQLMNLYETNAQYELSARVCVNAIMLIVEQKNRYSNQDQQLSSPPSSSMHHYQLSLDHLLMKLGIIMLDVECYQKAIEVFQTIYASLITNSDCLYNDILKISTLTHLFEIFLSIEDYQTSEKIIKAIETIRSMKLHKHITKAIQLAHTVESNNNGNIINKYNHNNNNNDDYNVSNSDNDNDYHHDYYEGRNFNIAAAMFTLDRRFNYGNNSCYSRNDDPIIHIIQPDHRFVFRYLRNYNEYNNKQLSKFALTTNDIDLGYLKALQCYRMKAYEQAMINITPTIINISLLTGIDYHKANRSALSELGKMLHFRGKIQLEASEAKSNVAYPIKIGSRALFNTVLDISKNYICSDQSNQYIRGNYNSYSSSMYNGNHNRRYMKRETFLCQYYSRVKGHKRDKKESSTFISDINIHSNEFLQYYQHLNKEQIFENPSDLCWDAMNWFRRAIEVFRFAGDTMNIAESSNALACCHISPLFIPVTIFKESIHKASSLTTYASHIDQSKSNIIVSERKSQQVSFIDLPPLSSPLSSSYRYNNDKLESVESFDLQQQQQQQQQQQSPTSTNHSPRLHMSTCGDSINRHISLDEARIAILSAIDINIDICLPFPLINSSITIAEMYALQGIYDVCSTQDYICCYMIMYSDIHVILI